MMTEQLQQLRGKSLSNEQDGNTVEALSLPVLNTLWIKILTWECMTLLSLFMDQIEGCVFLSGLQNLNEP